MNQFEEFENQILDADDDNLNTEIKINPDFYIHHALVNAQKSLLAENMKDGFIKYWSFIEHIEILCKSANMLPTDYEDKLKDFKQTDDYTNEENTLTKSVKLANMKLSLMMGEVFNRKTITEPLKVGKKP